MYKSQTSLNEYIITNLENDRMYSVNVVCNNKFGSSNLSNTESVIPNKNSNVDEETLEINKRQYDDSIESHYKSNNQLSGMSTYKKYQRRVSLFEQTVIINDLKDIIANKHLNNLNSNFYNVNVY